MALRTTATWVLLSLSASVSAEPKVSPAASVRRSSLWNTAAAAPPHSFSAGKSRFSSAWLPFIRVPANSEVRDTAVTVGRAAAIALRTGPPSGRGSNSAQERRSSSPSSFAMAALIPSSTSSSIRRSSPRRTTGPTTRLRKVSTVSMAPGCVPASVQAASARPKDASMRCRRSLTRAPSVSYAALRTGSGSPPASMCSKARSTQPVSETCRWMASATVAASVGGSVASQRARRCPMRARSIRADSSGSPASRWSARRRTASATAGVAPATRACPTAVNRASRPPRRTGLAATAACAPNWRPSTAARSSTMPVVRRASRAWSASAPPLRCPAASSTVTYSSAKRPNTLTRASSCSPAAGGCSPK